MTELDSFTPIDKSKIQLGQPSSFIIYDAWGNVLLGLGALIETQEQFDNLVENGYQSESMWDSVTPLEAAVKEADKTTLNGETKSKPVELNKESIMLDLDSVRWHVGETFFLQVHDNALIRYTVKLIGFVKNKSIFVTAPMVDGKVALIRDGQTFIVRAFPGKKAYAFTASAIKSVFSPHPYLHLSYPKLVRCTAIRQSSRASVKIIAAVTVGNPEQTAAATLTDLSMGGTSGIIKRQLGKKNDKGVIKFKVNAAGNIEYLTIDVILRSISPTENANEFRHGFEFVDVPAQANLVLSAFVHQTLAEIE